MVGAPNDVGARCAVGRYDEHFFGGSHPILIGPASCTDVALERDVSACEAWKPVAFLPYIGISLEWF